MQIDLRATPSLKNSAYIHKFCETHEYDFIGTMDDPQELRPFQIMGMLMELARIEEDQPLNRKQKPNLPRSQQWNHYPLKRFFALSVSPRITLTFAEIEKIEGHRLHPASLNESYWQEHKKNRSIAMTWISEGYELENLDLDHERITVRRVKPDSLLNVPRLLTETKLPVDARQELENS